MTGPAGLDQRDWQPETWQEQLGCGFIILCIGIAISLVIIASAWARAQ